MHQHLKAHPSRHSIQDTPVTVLLKAKRTHLLKHVLRIVGLSYYKSSYQDPNISHQGGEDDSEAEDFEVQASDFVILAARNEDEVSHIEVSSFPGRARYSDSEYSICRHLPAKHVPVQHLPVQHLPA